MAQSRTTSLLVVEAVLVALAVGACAGQGSVRETGTDPRVLVMRDVIGTDAQVFGEVRYLGDERCFILQWDDSVTGATHHFAAVWPPGTASVRHPDGSVGVRVPGVGDIMETSDEPIIP